MALASLNLLFRTDITDFTRKLRQAEGKFKRFGKQMQNIGKSMTRNMTLPLLAIAAASVKMASDVDASFTKIETLVGLSREQVDGMRKDVMKLSGQTGRSSKELADALFVVTSAGQRGATAMQILESAAKSAAIGMGETKDIARLVTSAMNAYTPEVLGAARATNILIGIAKAGNFEVSALAGSMGQVLPNAVKLGISFEELGANIATLTRVGISAEESVTSLNGLMSALIKPTTQGAEALLEFDLTYQDLRDSVRDKGLAQTLTKLVEITKDNEEAIGAIIPNIRALKNVLGTAGLQAVVYAEIVAELTSELTLLEDGFERTAETASFKFNQALQGLKNTGIEIGNKLLPIAVKLAEKISELADRFSKLSDKQVKNRLRILGLVAVAGPLLSIFGKFVVLIPILGKAYLRMSASWLASTGILGGVRKAMLALNITMKLNPFLLIATAIIAVGVALTVLIVKIRKTKKEIRGLQESVDEFSLQDLIEEEEELAKKLDELKPRQKKLAAATQERLDRVKELIVVLQAEHEIEVQAIKDKLAAAKAAKEAAEAEAKRLALLNASKRQIPIMEALNEKLKEQKEIIDSALPGQEERIRQANIMISRIKAEVKALEGLNNEIEKLPSKRAEQIIVADPTAQSAPIPQSNIDRVNQLRASYDELSDSVKKNGRQFIEFGQIAQSAVMEGISAIGSGIENLIAGTAGVGDIFKGILNTIASFMQALGKALIASALASEAFQKLLLVNPLAAAAAGVALLVGASVVKGLLARGPETPKLAGGGLAFGPTLAVVGDNPNARTDPEVIAPLSKLQGMGGSQDIRLTGDFRIRGNDLLLAIERQQAFNDRT